MKPIFADDIARATETARGFAEALAPILHIDDALVDMPPDDGRGYVPPLLMAAKKAGVDLRGIDGRKPALLYTASKVTSPRIVTVSVGPDGYTVRRGGVWKRARWRTLCKDVKKPATAIKYVKDWA